MSAFIEEDSVVKTHLCFEIVLRGSCWLLLEMDGGRVVGVGLTLTCVIEIVLSCLFEQEGVG